MKMQNSGEPRVSPTIMMRYIINKECFNKRFQSILWWKLQKWEKSDQNSWGSYVLDDFGTTSDQLDGLRYGLHTI